MQLSPKTFDEKMLIFCKNFTGYKTLDQIPKISILRFYNNSLRYFHLSFIVFWHGQ